MNKIPKLEYQQQVEKYLEKHQIYDIFEYLMKGLLREKPGDPLEFMASKLKNREPKRIFIIGPPGCRKKEKALTLAEEYRYVTVSVGDLLDREISKKSELGKKIIDAKSKFSFVSDSVVMELVNQHILELEKDGKNYVIEGYPRTRIQALGLQKMGIIPDKFFVLDIEEEAIKKKVAALLDSSEGADPEADKKKLDPTEVEKVTEKVVLEYNMNIKDVKDVFSGFYCSIDANQDHDTVVNEIARITKLNIRSKAPRRPPRVLLVGPPGSGKTTIGRLIAKKYGLIYVSASNLLNGEISNKTKIGKLAPSLMKDGELIPDEMMNELVNQRLNESDCKINGWVLEGFPKTEAQMTMLKGRKGSINIVNDYFCQLYINIFN